MTRLDNADVQAESGSRDTSLVAGLSGNFTLSGETRLRWDTLPGDPSALMVQVSAYNLPGDVISNIGAPIPTIVPAPIPEPGTALAFLAATLGLIGHRHRSRAKQQGKERDGSGGRI